MPTDDEETLAWYMSRLTDEEACAPPGCMLFVALLGGGALAALAELVRWFA